MSDPASDLDSIPIGTAQEERERAKSWMTTAFKHQEAEIFSLAVSAKQDLVARVFGAALLPPGIWLFFQGHLFMSLGLLSLAPASYFSAKIINMILLKLKA